MWGADASRWASAFRQRAIKLGYSDMDEDWLSGWFANVIEMGRVAHPDTKRERAAPAEAANIIPPVRKSRAKKAETEVQPDVTDIEPEVVSEYEGMSVEQRSDVLKSLMTEVMDKKGMETVYALLKEAKVPNRTEASKLPDDKLAAFVAALRKAVA